MPNTMKAINTFITKASKQLQYEFNITAIRAVDIIQRYIDIVYIELANKSTYRNTIDGTYRASIDSIQKQYRPMLNGNRVNIHHWLMKHSNKLRLFSIIEDGIKGVQYSAIKLHYNLGDYTDDVYTRIINGDVFNKDLVIANMYGKFVDVLLDSTLVDIGPINLASLQQYINTTLDVNNLKYAKRIYILAYIHSGRLLQVKFYSPYGRTYYKGVNLQSAPKEVRYAALGKCIELDLNNAALVYRINEAQLIDDKVYKHTQHYINNKDLIRNLIADECNTDVTTIKRVFTLIGFGGRGNTSNYKPNGKELAINDLLSEEQRNEFYNNDFIKHFLKEQAYMAKIINKKYKHEFTGMKKGQVLSSLYQHEETAIMANAFSHIPESTVLLKCHDAYYLTGISTNDLIEVKHKLKQYNPLLTISESIHT